MSEALFDVGSLRVLLEEERKLSADARRTVHRNALLAQGIHPATRAKVRPELGTCGDCAHHTSHSRNRTWHKCKLAGFTFGAATDIRVRWPACERFTPIPSDPTREDTLA